MFIVIYFRCLLRELFSKVVNLDKMISWLDSKVAKNHFNNYVIEQPKPNLSWKKNYLQVAMGMLLCELSVV
jgi:hypothetical protein